MRISERVSLMKLMSQCKYVLHLEYIARYRDKLYLL